MEIKYTKGQLIEAIKNKQKELGRTPTLYDFENIPISIFYEVFNSWNDALKCAGFKPNKECHKYTKKQLIEILQKKAKKLNRPLTTDDIKEPSKTIFTYTFGSWNNALKEAGLKISQKRKNKSKNLKDITKEQLIDILVNLMNEINKPLTIKEIEKHGLPSCSFIMKIFQVSKWGTIKNMIDEYSNYKSKNIDIPSDFFEKYIEIQENKITNEDMLNMLKNELLRLNTTSKKIFDAQKSINIPASATYRLRFKKTWEELLNLIGITYRKEKIDKSIKIEERDKIEDLKWKEINFEYLYNHYDNNWDVQFKFSNKNIWINYDMEKSTASNFIELYKKNVLWRYKEN